jgi:hypothetical protein
MQELLLVIKCMKLVLSRFNPLKANLNPMCHLLALVGAHHILNVSRVRVNDKKLVLSHKCIILIVTLISFMKSVRLDLVKIRLLSSVKWINLDLILLSLPFIIFGSLLMLNKKNHHPSTDP